MIYFLRDIDLTKSEKYLWNSIRKSYCAEINKGLQELKPKVFTSKDINWNVIDEFRRLHIKESGRETRSIESWERQYESIQREESFCVCGYIDSKMVSQGLFFNNNFHCYYAVSAARRDMFHKSLFHPLMWKAILHAKQIGLTIFETGRDETLSDSSIQLSDKEKSISFFKSGYGGIVHPVLRLQINAK